MDKILLTNDSVGIQYVPISDEQHGEIKQMMEGKTSIFVKDRDYFRRVDFDRIRWIEAAGSYCSLYLDGLPKLMLSFNLTELAGHLPSNLFVRVHRSYIVNISYIDSFIGNMLCLGADRVPISKLFRKDVISRLNVLGK